MPDALTSYSPDDDDDIPSPGSDRLEGAEAIALFYYGSASPTNIDRVYYGKRQGELPIGTENNKLVASKRKLRAHFDMKTENDPNRVKRPYIRTTRKPQVQANPEPPIVPEANTEAPTGETRLERIRRLKAEGILQ